MHMANKTAGMPGPVAHPLPSQEALTVKMSPCFSFILVRKPAASFPNSKAWPSQGILPRSRGGSPGRLQKSRHLSPLEKAQKKIKSARQRPWEAWRAAVHGVTKSRIWLSDWTTTSALRLHLFGLGLSDTILIALSFLFPGILFSEQ